jgi:hypothetical protein
VNRDASLSCRAPDSDASERRARAVPGGCSGNAVQQHAVRGAGRVRRSLRHSRSGRDRSSCRSGSGCGRRRTETAGLIGSRGAQTGRRHVDERHDCRDIGPAYVSSTMWGTASMRDRQVGLGAVLAPQDRNATPPLAAASCRARPAAPHRSRRHVVACPAITDIPLRQRFPVAAVTPPIQALRARFARVRAAIDTNDTSNPAKYLTAAPPRCLWPIHTGPRSIILRGAATGSPGDPNHPICFEIHGWTFLRSRLPPIATRIMAFETSMRFS